MKICKTIGDASLIRFDGEQKSILKSEDGMNGGAIWNFTCEPETISRMAGYPTKKSPFQNVAFYASLAELLCMFVLVRISDSKDVTWYDRTTILGGAYFGAAVVTFWISEVIIFERYSYRSDRLRLSASMFILWLPVTLPIMLCAFGYSAVSHVEILCILSSVVGAMLASERKNRVC